MKENVHKFKRKKKAHTNCSRYGQPETVHKKPTKQWSPMTIHMTGGVQRNAVQIRLHFHFSLGSPIQSRAFVCLYSPSCPPS